MLRAQMALNREEILFRIGDDADLLAELCDILLTQLPEMMSALQAAICANDAEGVCRAAHTLKGAISIFGAPAQSAIAVTLENLGREQRLDEAQNTSDEFVQEI
jgi:HPt (histidine-containing phosphotransfer) domain-containing protein